MTLTLRTIRAFCSFSYAPREQNLLKAGVNWQATEKLEFGVDGRYAHDKYTDSILGVQGSRTIGVNIDATYTYAENGRISAYFSWHHSKKDMRIGAAPGTTPGAVGANVGASYAALVAPTQYLAEPARRGRQRLWSDHQTSINGWQAGARRAISPTRWISRAIQPRSSYLATCGAATTLQLR